MDIYNIGPATNIYWLLLHPISPYQNEYQTTKINNGIQELKGDKKRNSTNTLWGQTQIILHG